MAYEMRAGSGSAFVNRKKEVGDKKPDFTGRVMLPDGEVRWLSVWKKKTESGDTWLSVAVGEVAQQSQHNQAKSNGYQPPAKSLGAMDDDIPW
jgi:uncharacterized protein (DUF736 family)